MSSLPDSLRSSPAGYVSAHAGAATGRRWICLTQLGATDLISARSAACLTSLDSVGLSCIELSVLGRREAWFSAGGVPGRVSGGVRIGVLGRVPGAVPRGVPEAVPGEDRGTGPGGVPGRVPGRVPGGVPGGVLGTGPRVVPGGVPGGLPGSLCVTITLDSR